MTSCERDLQSLYALASSNRSIPSSVSRARKPSPVVLSTLGIGNRNHSTRKKAARIAQILPPIRPSHTPCSPRRPARATVSRTALVTPYVPDITARSALDRVRRSLRSSGSLDEVSISRSSCRPWGRSVPRAPGGPVDLDRHPAGGGPRLDQLERRVRAGVGEQTRALADDHGEDQEVHLVDKVVGEQPPDQVAAAVHLQLPFLLGFQLADGGRDVTGEDGRVLPPRVAECGRGHVLGPRVQRLADGVDAWICHRSPGACEDLVGPPPEQECAGALVDLADECAGLGVEERGGPAAAVESAAVLVRSA